MLKNVLKTYEMVSKGVACVVAVRGRYNEHEKQYTSSQTRVQLLIMKFCNNEPWSTTMDDWIGYITELGFPSETQLKFAERAGNVVDGSGGVSQAESQFP